MNVLNSLIMVIISQCTCIKSSHYIPSTYTMLYMSIIPQKSWKKKFMKFIKFTFKYTSTSNNHSYQDYGNRLKFSVLLVL